MIFQRMNAAAPEGTLPRRIRDKNKERKKRGLERRSGKKVFFSPPNPGSIDTFRMCESPRPKGLGMVGHEELIQYLIF